MEEAEAHNILLESHGVPSAALLYVTEDGIRWTGGGMVKPGRIDWVEVMDVAHHPQTRAVAVEGDNLRLVFQSPFLSKALEVFLSALHNTLGIDVVPLDPSPFPRLPPLTTTPISPAPPPTAFIAEGTTRIPRDTPICHPAVVEKIEAASLRLVSVPERGRCLVTTKAYSPGDVVWEESAVVVWHRGMDRSGADCVFESQELRRQVEEISGEHFDDLRRGADGGAPYPFLKKWEGVVKKYAWAFSCGVEKNCAIFCIGSFVNHSCAPNTRYCSGGDEMNAAFRAIKPIAAGEEVTVTYTGGYTTELRLKELKMDKDFYCRCLRCQGPDLSRRIRCPPDRSRCSGFLLPSPIDPANPAFTSYLWRCDKCEAVLQDGDLPLDFESWIGALVTSHRYTDISAEHHLGTLLLAGRFLGPKHWTVAAIIESILELPLSSGIPGATFLRLTRILVNWGREVDHEATLCDPHHLQSLVTMLTTLQAAGYARDVLSLAEYLHPFLVLVEGNEGYNTKGVESVLALDPEGTIRSSFFKETMDWDRWEEGVIPEDMNVEFKERVFLRLAKLKVAMLEWENPLETFKKAESL
eukprot:Sspe_Gene.86854::Locus_57646_Transcript_1_1_Confidence_1.000_Length_3051::g.86854::m.86854